MSTHDLLDRIPRRWKAILAFHIARMLMLGIVGALAVLALRRAPTSMFLDIAELLFRVSLSGYWLYVFGVDIVEHMRSADTHAPEYPSSFSMRSVAVRTSLLTAGAAVILAVASTIGAHIEMMDAGHPFVAMLTVLAGVIDAKIVTDRAAQSDLFRL